MVHAFEAETGRLVWSAQLGERSGFARGVAANSFEVFASNAATFFAMDKKTGRHIWNHNLGAIPTTEPACNEELAMLGLMSGKIYAYRLKHRDDKGTVTILTAPEEAWNWQAGGTMRTRPLPAETVAGFGSSDGKAYVVMADERARASSGLGPAAHSPGSGTCAHSSLVPSGDNNLYAVDLFTTIGLWTFPSARPSSRSRWFPMRTSMSPTPQAA